MLMAAVQRSSISRAAAIDRESRRAESTCQNASDLVAASGVGCMPLFGGSRC